MRKTPRAPKDQRRAEHLRALLESAAGSTYDANPGVWDALLSTLNLDLRYQVTVAEVLRKGTWRTAANPPAYIATAAVRSARGKDLPDYFEKEFRRVASSVVNDDEGVAVDSAAGFNLENWGGPIDDDYYENRVPRWLQREGEPDTLDWETVAAYAVLKPRMACDLARTLIARLELRLGRPEAMARATNADEAAAIEAAWKWIDRNANDRIAPLFTVSAPPRTITAADIASFPLLAPGVSLRLDIQTHWSGEELVLRRTGLGPDGNDSLDVCYVEAESETEAVDELRLAASEGENLEIGEGLKTTTSWK
jgi:hypothetical protein